MKPIKNIVVLTGAGMSAESGLKTFREAEGLWEEHDVMEIASPIGWRNNKSLVLEFYNQRRAQLVSVEPNLGHAALRQLEDYFDVQLITQNVDDLHERAGSSKVLHLHGELFKVRSTGNPNLIYKWEKNLVVGDVCEEGHQLRPHIVWFGEDVPLIPKAIDLVSTADVLLIIGTSMQVYPASTLIHYVNNNTPIYFIDPHPTISESFFNNLKIIAEPATTGVPRIVNELITTVS
jgi:NAD-dependent deacetylase